MRPASACSLPSPAGSPPRLDSNLSSQHSRKVLNSKLKSHLRASRSPAKGSFLKAESDPCPGNTINKEEKEAGEWSRKRMFPERKLLVLDLDETLVHSFSPPEGGEYRVTIPMTDTPLEIGLSLRPYVREFLEKVSQLFEVVVFTSALNTYADAVLDFLDTRRTLIHHRLYRQHCSVLDGSLCKDLKVFSGVSLEQILICDNIVANFRLQLDNGVPVTTWTGEKEDEELVYLMDYLGKVSGVEDVREVNRQLFQLAAMVVRRDNGSRDR